MLEREAPKNPPLVTLTDVAKHFGAVAALKDVNLAIRAGECVGLVGHNGAGKSTLVSIINGSLRASEGRVEFPLSAADDALAAGVRSVFQELSLCPNLSLAENLRIAHTGMRGWGWRRRAGTEISQSLDALFPSHGIAAGALIETLSIAQRQMVEVAIRFAPLGGKPQLVILDEPTSSLDAGIANQLLDAVRRFCARGGAVIFISHMLGEIFRVADRILVMKDGRIVADEPADHFTRQGLVDFMGHVAAEPETLQTESRRELGEIVISQGGLQARRGEIVGLSGLAGHGQAEALATLYLDATSAWRNPGNPPMVFVAGDRKRDGILPLWSILNNMSLSLLSATARWGLVDQVSERRIGDEWKRRIGIRTESLSNPILSLSGGNQQKALFARALVSRAPIVVMDDPMRGVDVGTKQDVYALIRAEAAKGRTFLWYSTETEEVCQCDRVYVYRDGAISAALSGDELTEARILEASFEMQESSA
ncbi:ATP-binding cassette domain-containing protein [Salinicola rhizosphaerae]|uniref:ABC transporter ATP-binding protein n=1 Tax=Salinicola rhizosphaerae TaxID=1443141 RepID=A0ABQ3DZF6_9GAMM|nr:sugar ABC transporter ATP-binding protein [Salinicola rhizosphaerae]GHB19920.1 ABC transporter ATP-binding protein [Salinicola rhizosphaerae]